MHDRRFLPEAAWCERRAARPALAVSSAGLLLRALRRRGACGRCGLGGRRRTLPAEDADERESKRRNRGRGHAARVPRGGWPPTPRCARYWRTRWRAWWSSSITAVYGPGERAVRRRPSACGSATRHAAVVAHRPSRRGIADALAQCASAGAAVVVVLPGWRRGAALEDIRARWMLARAVSGPRIRVGEVIGTHPKLVDGLEAHRRPGERGR
jgi:hypothetical protein